MKALSKTLLVASLAGVSWLSSSHGQAAFAGGLYDVYVESSAGAGTYTKLAQLSAFTSPGTVQSFYSYGDFSFNGSTLLSSLKPNYSNLFLVEGTNGVSLGFIYNANNNPAGVGGLIKSEFVLSSNVAGAAPSANFKVIDDYVDDPTKIENITGPNSSDLKFTSLNGWGSKFTDGGLIGDLSETNTGATNNKWSITSKFIPIVTGAGDPYPSSGITNWVFLSPSGTNVATTNLLANRPNYNLLSELNGTVPKSSFKVLITPSTSGFTPTPAFGVTGGSGLGLPSFGPPITPAATPEPSSLIGLLMIGLVGGGAVVRSRFSKSEE